MKRIIAMLAALDEVIAGLRADDTLKAISEKSFEADITAEA